MNSEAISMVLLEDPSLLRDVAIVRFSLCLEISLQLKY